MSDTQYVDLYGLIKKIKCPNGKVIIDKIEIIKAPK